MMEAVYRRLEEISEASCQLQSKFNRRIAVYTCITNGYDKLAGAPPSLLDLCDFYCFSDEQFDELSAWNSFNLGFELSDPRRTAKVVKVLPHLVFPNYEVSLWVDGHIQIKDACVSLLQRFLSSDSTIMTFRHNRRDCLYAEAYECLKWGKSPDILIRSQIERYAAAGVKKHSGLYLGGTLFRRHNDHRCRVAMEAWWGELENYSVRDQISLAYVINKYRLGMTVLEFSERQLGFELRPHRAYNDYCGTKELGRQVRSLAGRLVYLMTSRVFGRSS